MMNKAFLVLFVAVPIHSVEGNTATLFDLSTTKMSIFLKK